MHPPRQDQVTRPAEIASAVAPVLAFHEVSKWYGNVIGINKLTLNIPAGVTGLLGPNGAGKSTLLQLATGQLNASQGTVQLLGQPIWNNPKLNRWLGLCPEQDAFYEWMTGAEFVTASARLSGMNRRAAREASARVLEMVSMTKHQHRAIKGYSKGMRQRTKMAQALVHEPQVLFLDEPFTGTDPLARRDLMDIVLKMGSEGKSVIVSSHVLHEVQSLTQNVVLLNHGRLVAEGNIRQIRELIDKYPHHIVIHSNNRRQLASQIIGWDIVAGIQILSNEEATHGAPTTAENQITQTQGMIVETHSPGEFYGRLPKLVLENDALIQEVYSDDDNLEAVFKYLVNS